MSDSWATVIRCALDLAPHECIALNDRVAVGGRDAAPERVRKLLAQIDATIPAERKTAMLAVLQRSWAGEVTSVDVEEPVELDVGAGSADLLPALAAGQAQAFEALFAAYADRLVRYVRRYLRSREEAEDVVQDLFLVLWDRRAELERVRDLEGYLYAAVRNRAMSQLKRRRTEARWREQAGGADSSEPVVGPDPFEPVASAEAAAALQRAIDSLPPRQREVVLRYWRGERNVEIAAALGISPMTIGVHLNRAIKRLREVMLHLPG